MNTHGILNTSNLEASVFLLMGGFKTVHDYRTVPEGHKRDILLNDVVVLGTSSAGMLGYRAFSHSSKVKEKVFKPVLDFCYDKFNKFTNTDFAKKHLNGKFKNLYKPIHSQVEFSRKVIGQTLSNVSMVACGLFGAILGDFVLTKTGHGIHKINAKQTKSETPFSEMERRMKTNVDAVVTRDVRREMVNRMTDMPAFSMFTTSLVGLQGLEITDNEKTSKQVKNATKYLMVNSLVPLFFLSTASALTKKFKNIYRIPIMFASLVGGTFLVKKAVDAHVNKKS